MDDDGTADPAIRVIFILASILFFNLTPNSRGQVHHRFATGMTKN
jgi:hypothetical protein